jgi:putative addiction module antidote
MTLELKIRRVGNSLGVIIPTEALALLNVREGDVLFLTEAAEGSVRLSAQRPGFAEKAAIADDLIQRYRNALGELAK